MNSSLTNEDQNTSYYKYYSLSIEDPVSNDELKKYEINFKSEEEIQNYLNDLYHKLKKSLNNKNKQDIIFNLIYIIKSNTQKYDLISRQLSELISFISSFLTELELVRCTCQLIIQLSRSLHQLFEDGSIQILRRLFSKTHDTDEHVIEYCQKAILSIVKHVQTHRILELVFMELGSPYDSVRITVSMALHRIICSWTEKSILPHLTIIESAVQTLIKDVSQHAVFFANGSMVTISKRFKSNEFVDNNSLDASPKTPKRSPISSRLMSPKSSNLMSPKKYVEYSKGQEKQFLSNLMDCITNNEFQVLVDNAENIAYGIKNSFQSQDPKLFESILSLFPSVFMYTKNEFKNDLPFLIEVIMSALEGNNRISLLSRDVFREIILFFQPRDVLREISHSETVIAKTLCISDLLRLSNVISDSEAIQFIISLMPSIAGSKDAQTDLHNIVSILLRCDKKSLLNAAANSQELSSVISNILRPRQKLRQKVSAPESLILTLTQSEDKKEALRDINEYLVANNCKNYELFLPELLPLLHSDYKDELEKVFQTIGCSESSLSLFNATIPLLRQMPRYSIEFLTRIIASSPVDIVLSKINEIMPTVSGVTTSNDPESRKASIFCFVELRRKIGASFEYEINKLPSLQRRLVRYYSQNSN